MKALKAPFPWFGGKSRCAAQAWQALGDVGNYVEPFAGSLAVLLARPSAPDCETVNDADCYIANFWRAVQAAPDEVARHADWPVNEADLHARHDWLKKQCDPLRDSVMRDPDFYDAKTAGLWVWGISAWIGSGWCESRSVQLPRLGDLGTGVHASDLARRFVASGTATVTDYMRALASRLRRVRVACGDWTRVTTPCVTLSPIALRRLGDKSVSGVLLDPPYSDGFKSVYGENNSSGISARVREWAIANGDNPRLRIVLCGYEGEHEMPSTWRVVARAEKGGYGNQSGNKNRTRERLWLSPHCLPAESQPLAGNIFDARSV